MHPADTPDPDDDCPLTDEWTRPIREDLEKLLRTLEKACKQMELAQETIDDSPFRCTTIDFEFEDVSTDLDNALIGLRAMVKDRKGRCQVRQTLFETEMEYGL